MAAFIPPVPLRPFLSSYSATRLSSRPAVLPRSPVRPATRPQTMLAETPASSDDPLVVMVNGLPGNMAAATASQVLSRGLVLAPSALTGPNMQSDFHVSSQPVQLIPPPLHLETLQQFRSKYPRLIAVDYTHPSAANANVRHYAAAHIPFVIGTTGGDPRDMHDVVNQTDGMYAVIAPNMAKQIVAFQAMLDFVATHFPNSFNGYSLTVKESHQSTKADTSGTAKAVVNSFAHMGLPFSVDDIEKVRDPSRSISEMNVPEHAVASGHAFHTYSLTSSDGSVNFQFQHNVTGRAVYAEGTVDAVLFLDSMVRAASSEKRVFSMIDVLRSGAMS